MKSEPIGVMREELKQAANRCLTLAEGLLARGKAERDRLTQTQFMQAASDQTAIAARLNDVADHLTERDAMMVYCGVLIAKSEVIDVGHIDVGPKPN